MLTLFTSVKKHYLFSNIAINGMFWGSMEQKYILRGFVITNRFRTTDLEYLAFRKQWINNFSLWLFSPFEWLLSNCLGLKELIQILTHSFWKQERFSIITHSWNSILPLSNQSCTNIELSTSVSPQPSSPYIVMITPVSFPVVSLPTCKHVQ